MCDSVMCEDMAGYYKHGPALFYHLPATFPAQLRGNAATATFPTHTRDFYRAICIFIRSIHTPLPPPSPPRVIEEIASVVCHLVKVIHFQLRSKVSLDDCILGLLAILTASNMYKSVSCQHPPPAAPPSPPEMDFTNEQTGMPCAGSHMLSKPELDSVRTESVITLFFISIHCFCFSPTLVDVWEITSPRGAEPV